MSQTYSPEPEALRVPGMAVGARATFIVRTYNHLFGAIVAFTLLEILYFTSGIAEPVARAMMSVPWLLVLGAFMVVSWMASRFAHNVASVGSQYLGLGLYVVAQSVLFIPLLFVANYYAPGAIESAAAITLLGFAALTGIAFWTRKDFSFLGSVLRWGMIVALLAIVGGAIFGFQLGTFFVVGMIGLAGAAILHDTSNVIHHFPEDRYVGAALQLFASVALMFWYVLSLFISRD